MSLWEYFGEGFKSLFEKVKSLDKKVLIGIGAGIAALIVATVVILVVSFGGKDTDVNKDDTYKNDKVDKVDDKDEDKEDESKDEEAAFTVKVVDQDGNPVAGVVVQVCKDACVPATSDETGVATFSVEITEGYKLSVVTLPEGYEYTGEAEIALEAGATEYELKIQKKAESTDGGNSSNGGQTAVQQPTVTNPEGEEIIGAGSKKQPYMELPGNDMSVTTVSIPAGKTLYYGIYRVGGMILTINNPNAYVITAGGTRYDAKNGKVSFKVESALASDAVMFQIGNKGGSATSFTIQFSNPTGSYANPTVLDTLSATTNLAKGDEVGHYYKFVAKQAGIIRFYITSCTNKCDVVVQNNRNSMNRTFAADVLTDGQGKQYIELKDVRVGDTLMIQVCTLPDDSWKYPANQIVWFGEYVSP